MTLQWTFGAHDDTVAYAYDSEEQRVWRRETGGEEDVFAWLPVDLSEGPAADYNALPEHDPEDWTIDAEP